MDEISSISAYLFPMPFVWWTKIENHQEIKQKYMPLVNQDYELNRQTYKLKSLWSCSVTSSFFSDSLILSIFDNYFINTIVWNTIDKMFEEMNEKIYLPIPFNSELKHIWYNRYETGDWQEIHDHASEKISFSGIYLIDINEENSTTFYNNKTMNCFDLQCKAFSTPHIEEGSVIWFPSELEHYVNPVKKERTTISFNIASEYGNLPSN